MSTEIEGLDELIKAFAELGDEGLKNIEPATIKASEKVMFKAKLKLEPHYKTGDAFHSLKVVKPSKTKDYKIFSKVTFGKAGAHIVPLELGHRIVVKGKTIGTVKEKPFLRPAADESKEDVAKIITAAMNETLDKMGGRK